MAASNVVTFPAGGTGSTGAGNSAGGNGNGGNGSGGVPPQPPRPGYAGPSSSTFSLRTVTQMRDNPKLTAAAIASGIFGYIRRDVEDDGGYLINAEGTPYIFDNIDQRAHAISTKNQNFTTLLAVRYGITAAEHVTKMVTQLCQAYALSEGRFVPVRRFAHFDTATQVLYLSRYNGTAWQLDGTTVTSVTNGTGALFLDDDQGVPVENPIIGPHGILFDRLVNDLQYVGSTESGLTPDAQKILLKLWILALPFGSLLPGKPLLLVEGAAGSGKTSAIQRIQAALHGHVLAQSISQRGEEDFGVTLLRAPIALIDNTDTYIEWLRDALCAYVTGGGWLRRRKYSDDQQVEVKPQSFIALATKNPATFRRDDVADRCLILRLDRRADKGGYVPMSRLLEQIRATRDDLFGEYLHWLNCIVAEIRAQRNAPIIRSKHRLADFARIASIIADAVGIPQADLNAALDAAQAERDTFVVEADPLLDLLDRWLENTANVGRSIKAIDLYAELAELAKKLKVNFYKSSKTLIDRLRDNHLALTAHFKIAESNGMYTIRRA
jgi:hypothetical protein